MCLTKSQEFLYSHSRVADQRPESSHRQLLVLWNGKVDTQSRFGQDEVTSDLTEGLPSRFLESLGCFLAGNVGKPSHGTRERREFRGAYDAGR